MLLEIQAGRKYNPRHFDWGRSVIHTYQLVSSLSQNHCMPGIFYTPLLAPGFGGSTGPLPGYLCSSADASQVLPAVSSVISVLTWSYNVAGIFMQMQ